MTDPAREALRHLEEGEAFRDRTVDAAAFDAIRTSLDERDRYREALRTALPWVALGDPDMRMDPHPDAVRNHAKALEDIRRALNPEENK